MSGDERHGLTVARLCRSFGGLQVLRDVGFRLDPGRVVGLIGPNGAGKSTLINCVTGVLAPDGGDIWLSGSRATGRSPDDLCRGGLSRTFQHARLLEHLTVLDNVLVGAHVRGRVGIVAAALRLPSVRHEEIRLRECAVRALDLVGCGHLADTPAHALTTGQQRLVSVARGLAGDPRFVLLDEPAAGLDDTETGALADALRQVAAGDVGLLIVEHHLELIMELCDEVLVLAGGGVVASGPPAMVRDHPAVVDAYLGTPL
ncbi:ABC transporter ATP-binding protein [Actinomadura syzygii]|uniref:ABC transporter ATP-binding protein n=1 Tax=Actinomadura syzygii TaxID=1427538 RepID=A0A5D0UEB8_9ACTN|nr:ABC transporter ATP-binding protein [Actinomadura syzygii]TYC16140.1 ABC transporter ATP-binding protein [Actinomadura syzygii]